MKSVPICFTIVLFIPCLITSEANLGIQKRNLVPYTSNYSEAKVLLLGVGDFIYKEENESVNFLTFFKEYGNYSIPEEGKNESLRYRYINLSDTSFQVDVEYMTNTSGSKMENAIFVCNFEGQVINEHGQFNGYKCSNDKIIGETKQNLNYTKITKFAEKIGEIPIIQSNYANQTMEKNLFELEEGGVDIYQFEYEYPKYQLDNITLLGNIFIIHSNKSIIEKNSSLIFNDKTYNCTISKLNEAIFNTTHKISFVPDQEVNEDLTFNVIGTDEGKTIIVFDTKKAQKNSINYNREDYVYHKEEGETNNFYIELLGIGNFNHKSPSENATGKAYFRGTYNYLKNLPNFIRFLSKVFYSNSTLRILEKNSDINTLNSTVLGIKDITNISKGLVIYNLTYGKTEKVEIINASLISDFQFSNSSDFANVTSPQIIINKDEINLTNSEPIVYKTMTFNSTELNFEGSEGFNFDFSPEEKIVFENPETKLVLNNSYNQTSLETIKCTLSEKKTNANIYNLICKPRKNISSFINTWRVIVLKTDSGKNLRNLADSTSEQIFYMNENSDKQLIYNYTKRNGNGNGIYYRKTSSGGLSGGTITGIVLTSVAAVAAVGIVAIIMNKMPNSPGKIDDQIRIPNSSTNINN